MSMRKPLISILVPAYNEELHIREFIESVLGQSYTSWELIIVDDGSIDQTRSIIDEYVLRDERVHRPETLGKLGKVKAFNLAFDFSQGNLIVLSGADDVFPKDSLQIRAEHLTSELDIKACGYFRLRTISESKRHDGLVIPKRNRGNRSGGTFALTRQLAELVFPIPEELVAEDIWLSEGVRILADKVLESPEIVLYYRIHDGNSNPRTRDFRSMNESMHLRAKPYSLMAHRYNSDLTMLGDRYLWLVDLENARYQGKISRIVFMKGPSILDKLRALSMSKETLWRTRQRFFRVLSGLG